MGDRLTGGRCPDRIGHVSTTGVQTTSPRRHLSDKRARTVERLTEAAVDELRETGYQGLSVRAVAARSGVAPATAYNYFSSKEHLVAEVFWRRISQQEERTLDRRRSPATRAADVLADFALVVANETELAAACTVALLADDPEVHELRTKVGRLLHTRLVAALDGAASPAAVRTLEFAVSGVLIEVGTGHLAYDDVRALLAESAALIVGGST